MLHIPLCVCLHSQELTVQAVEVLHSNSLICAWRKKKAFRIPALFPDYCVVVQSLGKLLWSSH